MTQRFQQNRDVETAPLDHGLMLLEPQARKFCALNPMSSYIWGRLREPVSPEQLATHIADTFQGVSQEQALQDVSAILEEMRALGIVVPVV